MADSDDEYDRKRRDKFRGERSSGGDNYRAERRDDRRVGPPGPGGRDDWGERNPFRAGGGGGGGGGAGGGRPRPDYRDYRGPRERFGSPGREMPPAKRMRPDWGDEMRGNPRYGPYDPYLMHAWNEHYAAHSMHGPYGHPHAMHPREPPVAPDTQTQPAMLTLKQFLDTQDDGISDSEVLRKYSDYKLEFKRQQLNEFFVAHKDEEWFKNKYHPLDSLKRKEEQLGFLKKRVDVFQELFESSQLKAVSIDTSQTEPLLRLLDTVVIKLEGGTEEDLKILDEKPKEYNFGDRGPIFEKKLDNSTDDDVIITSVETKCPEVTKVVSPRPVQKAAVDSDCENWDDDNDVVVTPVEPVVEVKKEEKKEEPKSLKRKRTSSDSSSTSSSDSDSSSSSSSDEEENEKLKEKYDVESVQADIAKATDAKEEDVVEKTNIEEIDEEKKDTNNVESKNDGDTEEPAIAQKEGPKSPLDVKSPEEVDEVELTEKDEKDIEDIADKLLEEAENSVTKDDTEIVKIETQPETIDLEKVKEKPQPRALHRTSSIFLRNLAPSITKAEIENICKGFNGYLRVAIADPLVERRWYRRGWVTFKRDVNIKEICWNLNNTRLRDCEMGAIVNRDLSRRVRPVNGMTVHKTIVRADIKLCAKIAMNLDEKFKLWTRGDANGSSDNFERANGMPGDNGNSFGFQSNNPVLQNITDYLIEEASAEEEELLGIAGDNKDSDNDGVDRDLQLLTVLDSLIFYLRIVHSVDFYNHCEYPYEDEMPNRCGIIHARGPVPQKVAQNDMQDYIKNFESKMQTFLAKTTMVGNEELKNLGSKDPEAEVEKFIQANTQELAKDKWLCPLSGKKFKGPEFIRKHIFNKHLEKVDEVRKEVEFFNNYLRDPKRPQLPEHPGSTKRTNSESSGGGGGGGYRPHMYPPAYGPPYAAYAPPMMMPGRGARGFGGGPRRPVVNEYRQIIQYRDLDAPQEPVDMFN